MSRFKWYIYASFFLLLACNNVEKDVEQLEPEEETTDLTEIIKRGSLKVLAENSSTSYFIYRGKKMGFEYELLNAFCKSMGLELEVVSLSNLDNAERMLEEGVGDIIACNYTITKERQKKMNFSIPFLRTPQVLVQRKPSEWQKMDQKELEEKLIHDPLQLAGKKVTVWKQSSYYQRLVHLQEEIGDTILIKGEEGDVTGEDLVEQVSEGEIDYTVVEKNIAQVNSRFYDNLDIQLELSVRQQIAFALRKSSPMLKSKLDEWLEEYMKGPAFRYTKRKYFELSGITQKSQEPYSNLKGGKISKFDQIFKREASKYKWDWRLIASVAYQESKFNPYITGFGGAYGMMQFMPEVGPKFGVYPDSPPEVQIAGGTKKLYKDYKNWPEIEDEVQRQKFALASYNAGLGHIKDAQRLARKHGMDPLKWDGNVELMVRNLSHKEYYQDDVVKYGAMRGSVTFKYVSSIFERYEAYKSAFQ